MISQKAKYAFHALVALARTESLMVGEIAAQEQIPRKFLEQILLELKRHGIVQSRRGKFGGYGLLMPADRITFGQVLRILDGPIAPLPCLSRIAYRRCSDCQTEENCEIRRVFAKVAESARDVLDRTTIEDAISNNGAAGTAVGKGLEAATPASTDRLAVRLRFHELIHHERGLLATRRSDVVCRDAGDGAPRRYVMQHHAAGRHAHAIADLDIAEDLGAGTHHHARANLGVAVAALVASAPKRNAMQERAIVADHRRLADDDAGGVIEHDAVADPRGGVDVDLENARREAL